MQQNTIKIEDRILLQQAIYNKNKEALTIIHNKYYTCIRRYITSRLASVEDAKDIAQNVFLELWKGNCRYTAEQDVMPYLLGISQNFIVRYKRKKGNQPKIFQVSSFEDFPAKNDVNRYEELEKIIQAFLCQIPPKAQEAIRLRFIEGFSINDAAKKAGCSVHTFCQRLYDAKKIIKKMKDASNRIQFQQNNKPNLI